MTKFCGVDMVNIGIVDGADAGLFGRISGMFVGSNIGAIGDMGGEYDIVIVASPENMRDAGDISGAVALINADTADFVIDKINTNQIITYGLASKSCVTLSHIGEEAVMLCIQRDLNTLEGRIIPPQECIAHTAGRGDLHHHLAAYICAMILGAGVPIFT